MGKKKIRIETVGDLKRALSEMPDEYKIHITRDLNDRLCIMGISDFDDECLIEVIE